MLVPVVVKLPVGVETLRLNPCTISTGTVTSRPRRHSRGTQCIEDDFSTVGTEDVESEEAEVDGNESEESADVPGMGVGRPPSPAPVRALLHVDGLPPCDRGHEMPQSSLDRGHELLRSWARATNP